MGWSRPQWWRKCHPYLSIARNPIAPIWIALPPIASKLTLRNAIAPDPDRLPSEGLERDRPELNIPELDTPELDTPRCGCFRS
ncbi:MAG: hypothetical protein HC925_04110 [Coleofasciculaceae cyanobacterium SM2_3_26]|nr:hypothetical protein [Coleofasciculaceae cyanobacterium SM2_3_26]